LTAGLQQPQVNALYIRFQINFYRLKSLFSPVREAFRPLDEPSGALLLTAQ